MNRAFILNPLTSERDGLARQAGQIWAMFGQIQYEGIRTFHKRGPLVQGPVD